MIFYIVTAPALKNMNQPPLRIITPRFPADARQMRVKTCAQAFQCALLCFLKEDPSTIIGTVCLHNIIKMPYFTSEVGYKFDASYQHHGYARKLCLWHCLSAFMVSDSTKSLPAACLKIRLQKPAACHAGFFEEGIERQYSHSGKMEDHIRYAILNPDEIHS